MDEPFHPPLVMVLLGIILVAGVTALRRDVAAQGPRTFRSLIGGEVRERARPPVTLY